MNPTTKKAGIAAALVVLGIAIGAGAMYVHAKLQDIDRMVEAREAAPDKEKFDKDFEAMGKWFEDYKRENPGSSDEDARREFDRLWSNR